MSVHYYYREVGGSIIDITDRCRLYTLDVVTLAEEGAVGSCQLIIDDPLGDLIITGHRLVFMKEDAIADTDDQVIWAGYTNKRKVTRGPYKTLAGRQWVVDLDDINTVLDRRIMVAGANRPDSSDVALVQWLEATDQGSLIDDTTYLSTANPVHVDGTDYRGQKFRDVIDNAAQDSGKNYTLLNLPEAADVLYGLWYDYAASEDYASTLRISNVLADCDGVTTFYALDPSDLDIDPSRVYSGGYGAYDGGAVYIEDDTIKDAFALEGRDTTVGMDNVKKASTARARVRRYLNDMSTEEEVIETGIDAFPARLVNHIKPYHRIQVKFSHLPGYEDFTWMRVGLKRTQEISEDPEAAYRISLKLVSPSPHSGSGACAVTPADDYDPLGGTGAIPNASGGNVLYLRPGITYPTVASPGHVGSWHFPIFGGGGSGTVDYAGTCTQNIVRCIVEGEGTITIHTAIYDGSPRDLSARLMHVIGTGDLVVDEYQAGTTGDDFVFEVSTHGGANCTHWVDVTDTGAVCGGAWGFSGMEWAT